MAAVGSRHQFYCRDNTLSIAKDKRTHVVFDANTTPMKRKGDNGAMPATSIVLRKHRITHLSTFFITPQKGKLFTGIRSLSSDKKHLKSLDSYLGKLHNDVKQPSSNTLNQRTQSISRRNQLKAEKGLRSLDVKPRNYVPSASDDENLQGSLNTSQGNYASGREKIDRHMELKTEHVEEDQKSADNVSDFYLIGVLASINIAVFLFEMATPTKNSNFELFSLPLVYGAKINNLILDGEWWRLVTPIFLHSGIFHIALGSWVLFTFGLEVSREYGSLTFFLIYILGGISGNLISFLHTPEPTVGGTGPVFAIIGAWLIYQVQNRGVIATNASESMFQKAIISTVLSFVLSNFCPIDDWSHFGAAFTGIVYGFFTCPTLQVKDASSDTSQDKRIALVRQYADPCKSLIYFSLFLLLLSSLLLIIEPPLSYMLE